MLSDVEPVYVPEIANVPPAGSVSFTVPEPENSALAGVADAGLTTTLLTL